MKKRFLVIFSVFLAFPIFAESEAFTIKNYDFYGFLHKNNSIEITETIEVDFTEARHGIYRRIPLIMPISFNENFFNGNYNGLSYIQKRKLAKDETIVLDYKNKISKIDVYERNFSTDLNENSCTIKIGDSDSFVSGRQKYIISYTLTIPDDRLPQSDFFYYSVLGSEWNTTTDNFNFTIEFEKEIPEGTNPRVFSGEYGKSENALGVNIDFSTKKISGSAKNLKPNEAITLRFPLPEGYFVGEYKNGVPDFILWIVFSIIIVVSSVVIFIAITESYEKPVQTVEFYPPEGIGSAEVGYIIDSSADTVDLLSLVPYFAEKGYLKIREIPKKNNPEKIDYLELEKITEIDDAEPEYKKTIFSGLFKNGNVCNMKKLGEDFGKSIQKAKSELASIYKKEKALYTGGRRIGLIVFLEIFFVLLFNLLNVSDGVPSSFIFPEIIVFFVSSVVISASSKKKNFEENGKSVGKVIATLIGMILIFIACNFISSNSKIFSFTPHVVALFSYIALCVSPRFEKMTPYNLEITGKLLGFKEFIKLAEVPKLKELLDKNPDYFYDVLPYAMVFGLTENWANHFTKLNIKSPSWYESQGKHEFEAAAFATNMKTNLKNSFSNAQAELRRAEAAESHSHGSGFSGGGAGGGGGGSW